MYPVNFQKDIVRAAAPFVSAARAASSLASAANLAVRPVAESIRPMMGFARAMASIGQMFLVNPNAATTE